MLSLENLSVRIGERDILSGIRFALDEGEWLMLVGPNGAGKTTIVNAIAGAVKYEGTIRFQGEDLRSFSPEERARRIGFLAQESLLQYPFAVEDVVRLGRYAYRENSWKKRTAEAHPETGRCAKTNAEYVQQALEMTGLEDLRDRSVLTLSGGEQQRVFLAQLFAQDPQIMILDEPTNHLDLIYQKQIFSLVENWRKEKGRAVLSVVHDLSLAKAYGSRAVLLREGRMLAEGSCEDVLSAAHLQEAYDMDVEAWMNSLLSQWT